MRRKFVVDVQRAMLPSLARWSSKPVCFITFCFPPALSNDENCGETTLPFSNNRDVNFAVYNKAENLQRCIFLSPMHLDALTNCEKHRWHIWSFEMRFQASTLISHNNHLYWRNQCNWDIQVWFEIGKSASLYIGNIARVSKQSATNSNQIKVLPPHKQVFNENVQ